MKYEFSTATATIFDGQTVPAGTVVATLETNLPIGNVISSIAFGSLRPTPVAELSAPVAREAVGTDSVPTSAPRKETKQVEDPDDLNEQDNASDTANANADTGSSDKPSEPSAPKTSEPELVIDESLKGLSERIAKSLTTQSLGTRQLVALYLDGGNDLLDLDGIGKKAAEEIKAWLAN